MNNDFQIFFDYYNVRKRHKATALNFSRWYSYREREIGAERLASPNLVSKLRISGSEPEAWAPPRRTLCLLNGEPVPLRCCRFRRNIPTPTPAAPHQWYFNNLYTYIYNFFHSYLFHHRVMKYTNCETQTFSSTFFSVQ